MTEKPKSGIGGISPRTPHQTPPRFLFSIKRTFSPLLALPLLALLLLAFPAMSFAACASPAGNEGDYIYNGDYHVYQFCNGTNWIQIGLPRFAPTAVSFDGATSYLTIPTTLTGVSGGTMFTGSVWFRRKDSNNATVEDFFAIFSGVTGRMSVNIGPTNKLQFRATDSSSTVLINEVGTTNITDSNWHHVVFSFDVTNAAHKLVYLDDVAETFAGGTFVNGTIDFAPVTSPTAGVANSGVPSQYCNCDIADLWVNIGTYIDLSVTANRRYFIDANMQPVYLGIDGSNGPTGAAPTVFMSGSLASWATNKGTGGGFTVHGTPTLAAFGPKSAGAGNTTCGGGGNAGDMMYNKDNHVYQFCNDANWQAMGKKWTGADGGGCSGPSGSAGNTMYNHDYCVMQYCDSSKWNAIGSPHARDCNNTCGSAVLDCAGVCGGSAVSDACGVCNGVMTVGEVCTDGSVYAGLSTDGNVPMYTQRCDIGMSWGGSVCTGGRTGIVWSAGTTITTGITNVNTGQANTLALYPLSNADSPYTAAITCHSLNEDGHTDWYLPALNELNVLYTGRVAIGNFDTTDGGAIIGGAYPGLYWTSTEYTNLLAWFLFFNNGSQNHYNKNDLFTVRCVRR